MQIAENEIIIPFKYKSRLKGILIRATVFLVIFVSLFSYLFFLSIQIAARASRFPNIQTDEYHEIIFGVAALLLILVAYAMLFIFLIRRMRAPSPYLRINQEGIFTSHSSFLIKWVEIKELYSSVSLGYISLKIVPWNLEELASRAKATSSISMRLGIIITLKLFRKSKSPAPLGINQMALPIPIDELLTTIQEHFAVELREHHIIVQGWQN